MEENRIDAVLCSNNVISYHILRGRRAAGIPVPGRLGMVTFDNYPLVEYMEPPLTAVDVDTYRLGEITAGALIEKLNSREVDRKNVLIDTELIRRASSEREKECLYLSARGIGRAAPEEGFFEFLYANQTDAVHTPLWRRGQIFYQIFPERFGNGDPKLSPPDCRRWGTPPQGKIIWEEICRELLIT